MRAQTPLTSSEVVADELAVLRPHGTEERPLTALCISGGGIRSAAFALGALQGLAERDVLAEFDYLSTVSGGGYIGGWLTSWSQRAGGLESILPKLRPGGPLPDPGDIDPIGHLRKYNYSLSPTRGFLSLDTWTQAATVICNMALNWLVVIPLLMFALMAPRLMLSLGSAGLNFTSFYGATTSAVAGLWLRIAVGLFLSLAIFNIMRYLPGVGGRNHTENDFLKYCLAPMILAALAFMLYDSSFNPSIENGTPSPRYWGMVLWFSGSFAAGWISFLVFGVRGIAQRLRFLFGPLSFAIVLTSMGTGSVAWLVFSKLYAVTTWPYYTAIGPPLLFLSFMAAGLLFVGLTSRILADGDREFLSRAAASMLAFAVCWSVICGIVLIAPGWIFTMTVWVRWSIAAAGALAGWAPSLIARAGPESASDKEAGQLNTVKDLVLKVADKLGAPVFIAAVLVVVILLTNWLIATPVFVAILLVALAILTNWLMAVLGLAPGDWTGAYFLESTRPESVVAMASAFLAFGWVASRFIDVNKFSLNRMYRTRLIRAFLGASNARSETNRFTGFNESDNISMAHLNPKLKPLHLVNITVNQGRGRKADSFTVSALHTGSAGLGYRPSSEYAGGISLGTAITLSGASGNPGAGYHASGVITFIMTLFNARLGSWLGNPGIAGERTWRQTGPRSAAGSLVKETFGLNDDTSAYVYLSDGGHFENLGLYEMVRRRCRRIVVLDSSCDPAFTFSDLGNALLKIQIDMDIAIDFDESLSNMRSQGQRWAVARIRYSEPGAEDKYGTLVYVKPMIRGNEPPTVIAYHASHPNFPHEGMGNHCDDSQTESYRMLGLHAIREMCDAWEGTNGLSGLFASLSEKKARAVAAG